jgi:hypothetical protein
MTAPQQPLTNVRELPIIETTVTPGEPVRAKPFRKPPISKGRPKGAPNKVTGALKEAILEAGNQAGGPDGLIGYLRRQAEEQPVAFLGLLGKVLPLTIKGDPTAPIMIQAIERRIVDPIHVNPRN